MPSYHYQRGAPRQWHEDRRQEREREERFRVWRAEQRRRRWARVVNALKLIGFVIAVVLVSAAFILEAPRRRR